MGLNIYLRRYEDFESAQKREAEYEAESTRLWGEGDGRKYDEIPEKEKESIRASLLRVAERLNLDTHGTANDRETIEIDSTCNPKHYCKIGYFRSSYNDAGFNSVIRAMMGKEGYYWIFNYGRDDAYEFRPDWKSVRERAEQLLAEYDAVIKRDGGLLRTFHVEPNMFETPSAIERRCASTADALNIYRREAEKWAARNEGGSYSNRDGYFFSKPMSVLALVSGKVYSGFGTYVIYRDEEDSSWYRDAIRIVIETCDYVLKRKDIEKFYVAWSS